MIAKNMRDGRKLVLFKNGQSGMFIVYIVEGACFVGDPTAYVLLGGRRVYVRPGESVSFVEA